jgi:hypothetical protein
MRLGRHLSWSNFKASTFVRGEQRVHRISNSPIIEIFGDGIADRIGIWLEASPNVSLPTEIAKLSFIATKIFQRNGHTIVEFASLAPALHRQFYHFATAVSERVVVDKLSPVDAAVLELQCFAELLKQSSILAVERQLGLLGELIFLERLRATKGEAALDAWLGPIGEPHDFRIGTLEFEIKTTVRPYRIHAINGTEQLVPTHGCKLFLISVQLAPAGASDGFSLADKIQNFVTLFQPTPLRLQQFVANLEMSGVMMAELSNYNRRFTLRRPLAVIPVNKKFPAITRPLIQRMLGSVASRVESLNYEVNLEGLEQEDGTEQFTAIIQD